MYVLYQLKDDDHLRISELIYSPHLALGKTWYLNGKKMSQFGYSFAYGGNIYFGDLYTSSRIQLRYNLEQNKFYNNVEITLPDKSYTIGHIYYCPDQNMLLLSESCKVSTLKYK